MKPDLRKKKDSVVNAYLESTKELQVIIGTLYMTCPRKALLALA